MIIRVYNDGKHKYQSWEAWSKEFGFIDTGYGRDQEDAIKKFMLNVENIRHEITMYDINLNKKGYEIEHTHNFLDK